MSEDKTFDFDVSLKPKRTTTVTSGFAKTVTSGFNKNIKEIDLDTKQSFKESRRIDHSKANVREIDINERGRQTQTNDSSEKGPLKGPCVCCNSKDSPYRYVTKEFLCTDCRQKHPYKLITRSTCYKMYGLNFKNLYKAYQDGTIQMITAPNFRDRSAPPVRLYYEHEIHELVSELEENN